MPIALARLRAEGAVVTTSESESSSFLRGFAFGKC